MVDQPIARPRAPSNPLHTIVEIANEPIAPSSRGRSARYKPAHGKRTPSRKSVGPGRGVAERPLIFKVEKTAADSSSNRL
jgi:hypothetical protein